MCQNKRQSYLDLKELINCLNLNILQYNHLHLKKNKELCTNSIRKIFHITDYSFNKYRKLRENETIPVHGNIGRLSPQQKTTNVISWFRNFVESVGEKQPNSSFTHLPNYLNKSDLYKEYVKDMKIGNEKYVSYSQFCQIWINHMSDVKIPTYTTQ